MEEKIDESEQEYNEEIKSLKKQIDTLQFENKKLQRDFEADKVFHEEELSKIKKVHDLLKI